MNRSKLSLVLAIIFGALTMIVGVLFLVAGAGMYGSPMQGDAYFNTTLLLILIFGPFAVLPCVLFDIWKPGLGGLALCASSLIDVVMIVLNNISSYGTGLDAYNSLTATSCVALPIFIIGSVLYFSRRNEGNWHRRVWQALLVLFVLTAIFFVYKIGPDYWFFVERLSGGPTNPPEIME